MYSKNLTVDRQKRPNEPGAFIFGTKNVREYRIMRKVVAQYPLDIHDTTHLDGHERLVFQFRTRATRAEIDEIKAKYNELIKPLSIRRNV